MEKLIAQPFHATTEKLIAVTATTQANKNALCATEQEKINHLTKIKIICTSYSD